MHLTQLDIKHDCELVALYIRRWRAYALSFHIEAMQAHKYWYPTKQQADLCALRDRHRFVAVAAGRGVGKTWWLAGEIFRFLICFRVPGLPTKVPITGPSGGQLSDVIWAEIAAAKTHLLPWLADRFELTSENLYCKENKANWFASPRTARKETPQSLMGQHGSTLNAYDESSGVPDSIFNVTTSSMTQETAHAIMLGNPDKLSGYFYRVFNVYKKSRWVKYHMDCRDCRADTQYPYSYIDPLGDEHVINAPGIISSQWFIDQENELGRGSAAYEAYVCGNFPKSEEEQLIKKIWVDRAWERSPWEVEEPSADESMVVTRHRRIISIDPGYKRDPLGVVIRFGDTIEYASLHTGLEQRDAFHLVVNFCDSKIGTGNEIDVLTIDGNGIGYGLYEDLLREFEDPKRSYKVEVVNIMTQETAPDVGVPCRRLRDSLWWQMRLYFQNRNVAFLEHTEELSILCTEVGQPRYSMENGKIVVESKDKMKSRGVSSPNLADPLSLTFAVDSVLVVPQDDEKKLDAYDRKAQESYTDGSWLAI
jgi:hypothetical protein